MNQKKYLSARQVAEHCQVNLKTVLKWIEVGKLKAYQLPDSGVNRISLEDCLDFLKRYNMPVPEALGSYGLPRILIVDDELLAISMLKRIFRANEFEVEEARDGFEAGRKVEVFKPDILLLDLKMPGMSGEEVLREIKSN